MPETKRISRTFFAWQEEKESAWLSRMSTEGWHLHHVGFMNYCFAKGEPRDYVYQFDFITLKKREEPEYSQLYADAGWEKIDRMGAWYYFRKLRSAGGSQTIYSDKSGLIRKYRRIFLVIAAVTFPIFYNLTVWPRYYRSESALTGTMFQTIAHVGLIVLAGLSILVLLRLALHIRRIKRTQ